jgi:hypothetical protein
MATATYFGLNEIGIKKDAVITFGFPSLFEVQIKATTLGKICSEIFILLFSHKRLNFSSLQ